MFKRRHQLPAYSQSRFKKNIKLIWWMMVYCVKVIKTMGLMLALATFMRWFGLLMNTESILRCCFQRSKHKKIIKIVDPINLQPFQNSR